VNKPSDSIAANHSEQPKDQENDKDRPQHEPFLLFVHRRLDSSS
jgi:hypothetical protein